MMSQQSASGADIATNQAHVVEIGIDQTEQTLRGCEGDTKNGGKV